MFLFALALFLSSFQLIMAAWSLSVFWASFLISAYVSFQIEIKL